MDTTAILSWRTKGNPVAETIEWIQQVAAQLAALRELLESEQARLATQRRREAGWPPRGSEPLSHIT